MSYLEPTLKPINGVQSKTYPEVKKISVTQMPQPKSVTGAAVVKTAAQTELEMMIAEQLTDRRFAPVTHEGLTKNVTFVTAANGLFKVTKTPIGLFKEEVETFKTNVIGLPEMTAGVELVIPKIPMKWLIQALSFYRDVNTNDKTEASTLFFWNHEDKPLPILPGLSSEGKLVIYCPTQVNSATLSDFSKDDNVHWLRSNMALLFELHSHNTMDAFFSGTDDANENMTQFYGVWGKVANEEPMFIFRYVAGNSKIISDPSILFEWPRLSYRSETVKTETVTLLGDTSYVDAEFVDNTSTRTLDPVIEEVNGELLKGPFKMLEYPEDWMAQHSRPKYTAPTSTYGKGWGVGSPGYYGGSTAQTDLLSDEDYWGGYYGSGWNAANGYEEPAGSEKKLLDVNKGESTKSLSLDELDAAYEDVISVSKIGSSYVGLNPDTITAFIDIAKEVVLHEEDVAEFEKI